MSQELIDGIQKGLYIRGTWRVVSDAVRPPIERADILRKSYER